MADEQRESDKTLTSNESGKTDESTPLAKKTLEEPSKSSASVDSIPTPKPPQAKSEKAAGTKTAQITKSPKKAAKAPTASRKKTTAEKNVKKPTPPKATEPVADPTPAFQQTTHKNEAQDDAQPEPSAYEAHTVDNGDEQHWLNSLWRFFGIIVFGFVSYILLMVTWVCSAIQFFVILIQRKPNEQLFRLTDQISAYMDQILHYLAGRTDATDLPFPLGPLPEPGSKADTTNKAERDNI